MNPSGMTGEPNSLNRPSVFSEHYPPPTRVPFDWNAVPGTSQGPYGDLGAHQNPGFNMQPQIGINVPNFQFSNNQLPFGGTVQFPFPNAHMRNIERPMWSFGCKRKTDSPPPMPAKQHITEEKMSEHLSKLHISSETPSDMESDQVKERRLYMCDEMKKFQAQTESIIPESLLSSINRPCTALVLWKPPSSILVPSLFTRDREDETENNNNNSARDNNPVPTNDMDFDDL
ncbi:hypothetical protein HHI36_010175 [Cryptolaemus montrouzieri]|uniref:Uncharacterized protein n=1 Tax=Cryptolaemus montrouzieri TaxID=559131 RepID=A0ABD2MHW4_9CUCU